MNNQRINQHFASLEIIRRGLDFKTALSETANVFARPYVEIVDCVLGGTGFDRNNFGELETVVTGKLLKGDLVLNSAPGNNAKNPDGAFNIVEFDGTGTVDQCWLVLRRDVPPEIDKTIASEKAAPGLNKTITRFLATIGSFPGKSMSEVIKANRTDADGQKQPFGVADWDNLFQFVARHDFVEFVADETGIAEIWLTDWGKNALENCDAIQPCKNSDCTNLIDFQKSYFTPFCSNDCKKQNSLWGQR